jgi:Fe-S-cluster-containing hydrogenase component 2
MDLPHESEFIFLPVNDIENFRLIKRSVKMATEVNVYRALQKHLDKMPLGYPPTKSGVEINILKSIFTPEQAKIATYLDYKHKTIDQIYETAEVDVNSKEELKRVLDETVSKGGISRRNRDGTEQYAVLPFLSWGMYEHQLKRLNQAFLDDSTEYITGEYALELATGSLPLMRVIPIEESVEAEHYIATYDELFRMIEQAGERIAIQECFCRKAGDLQEKPCQATDRREVCMSFGDLADLYVEEGWARKINQQEALEMARLNEKEGLVLMPGNDQEPNFMCSCCNDCCLVLTLIKNYPKPAEAVASNYNATVNTELCTGVGACVERCPLGALSLNNGFATIELARCIGCGLCVPVCPEDAISMVKKELEITPPLTMEERFDLELAKKNTLAGKIRNYSLKTFLRIVFRLAPAPDSTN